MLAVPRLLGTNGKSFQFLYVFRRQLRHRACVPPLPQAPAPFDRSVGREDL